MMSPGCPKERLAQAGLGALRLHPPRAKAEVAGRRGAEAGEARVAMSGLSRLFGRGECGRAGRQKVLAKGAGGKAEAPGCPENTIRCPAMHVPGGSALSGSLAAAACLTPPGKEERGAGPERERGWGLPRPSGCGGEFPPVVVQPFPKHWCFYAGRGDLRW